MGNGLDPHGTWICNFAFCLSATIQGLILWEALTEEEKKGPDLHIILHDILNLPKVGIWSNLAISQGGPET